MAKWSGMTPREWVELAPQRVEAVYRGATTRLANRLVRTTHSGGRLPHRTGNLMRSLLATTAAPVKISDGPFEGVDIGLVIAELKLTDKLYIGYQAVYARRMNYGFKGADSLGRIYNHEGFGFFEDAIARWPDYVRASIREVASKGGF